MNSLSILIDILTQNIYTTYKNPSHKKSHTNRFVKYLNLKIL